MPKKLTARQKLERKKEPKKVKLTHNFAGIKEGQMMYVATPMIVDDYIKTLTHGEVHTIPQFRTALAELNQCDASCPVSTSIFIRMCAEAAIEDMKLGKAVSEVTPFWRLLTGEDKISKKLPIDPVWIDEQRDFEKQS